MDIEFIYTDCLQRLKTRKLGKERREELLKYLIEYAKLHEKYEDLKQLQSDTYKRKN